MPQLNDQENSSSWNARSVSSRALEFFPNFTKFKIIVGGTTIDLPRQVRRDYFYLRCSQKSYLSKSIDRELAAAIISGLVAIANAIRECKISTPQDDVAYWNTTLDGFEIFGMKIGFLKARLIRLSGLTLVLKRFKKLTIEQDSVEEIIGEYIKKKRRLDCEIENM